MHAYPPPRVRISIHAPRGGSDFGSIRFLCSRGGFQSTLPVGGATASFPRRTGPFDISIHAPRGGSDISPPYNVFDFYISIHAPRGGSDVEEMQGK